MKALFFLAFMGMLAADLADHLQPLSRSPRDAHAMRGIDCIYMINLDERPEKFAKCIEALAPYGINPMRVSAINGWELSIETINDVGVKYQTWMADGMAEKIRATCFLPEHRGAPFYEPMSVVGRTYFCDQYFLGSIGCALSHASVLQDADLAGYETIWIMEDDIEIIRDPNLLPGLIDKLDDLVGKKGWDILFTDRDTKDKQGNYVPCVSYSKRPNFMPADPERFGRQDPVSDEFRKVGARYGTYSMILRKSGVRKLLGFLKAHQIFLAYDMEVAMPNGIRLFTVLDDIVSTQPQAPTDNGAPNYRSRGQS